MKNSRVQASAIFKQGVMLAVEKANHSGFVAATRFTILADLMQIQCLYFDNTDLMRFTLPVGLYGTVTDLAAHIEAKTSAHESDSKEHFTLEFPTADDQDKFIQFFEMLSYRGARAYPTPDLYLGEPVIDKELCNEILRFLHATLQSQHEAGWNRVR
jgi:hypothetical protein